MHYAVVSELLCEI